MRCTFPVSQFKHLEMYVLYWVGLQWLPGYPVPVKYLWSDYNFSEVNYIETHLHLSAKVKIEWSHTSSPLMSSWCGQGKHLLF